MAVVEKYGTTRRGASSTVLDRLKNRGTRATAVMALIAGTAVVATGCSCAQRGHCNAKESSTLQQDGFAGEHPLVDVSNFVTRPVSSSQASSEFGGGFFLGIGAVGGSSESASGSTLVQSVRFAWEANSPARAITLSTVPVDKVQYEVDNNIKEPEVSFEMSIGTLTQGNTTTVNSPNFNYFVNQAVEVVFKVTQADYDNAQRQFNTTG
jgi:hypothetical protein